MKIQYRQTNNKFTQNATYPDIRGVVIGNRAAIAAGLNVSKISVICKYNIEVLSQMTKGYIRQVSLPYTTLDNVGPFSTTAIYALKDYSIFGMYGAKAYRASIGDFGSTPCGCLR